MPSPGRGSHFHSLGVVKPNLAPPEALTQVAAYFQALSEPTRLQILNLLREKERNVGELAVVLGAVAFHHLVQALDGLMTYPAQSPNAAIRDVIDRGVGAVAGLSNGGAASADVEHPAAGGEPGHQRSHGLLDRAAQHLGRLVLEIGAFEELLLDALLEHDRR